MRPAMRRTARISLYVVGCLALLEICARLLFAWPYMAERRIFRDDLSWRRWWVRVHRSGQPMLYGFDRYDATKGWLPRPNLRDVRAFPEASLSTNSRGLRGTVEYAAGKRPGVFRIVILGDSFTFGDEVEDAETYAMHLQRLLPGAEVVNLGVHGYGHDQMLILFREEGVPLSPDVVILGFVEVDMARNLRGFRDYAKPRFVAAGDGLRLVGSPVPRPEEIIRWEWARPRLVDAWSIVESEVKLSTGLYRREEEALTTRILAEISKTARGIGATPVLAYLPLPGEIESAESQTDGERYLLSVCPHSGAATCFSTRPAFLRARARGVNFGAARHWNSAGHRVVAEDMLRHLTASGLVPPR